MTPEHPDFFDCATIESVEWNEQLKPGWWDGTITAHLDGKLYTIEVQGDPDGDAFREWEQVIDWEVEDVDLDIFGGVV